MMSKIREYPDAVLRRRAEQIERVDDEIKELADQVVSALMSRGGYGLAAPQVGISKRLIAIDVEEEFHILINPVILERSEEKVIGIEGCLSIPGVEAEVERASEVRVEALNLRGEEIVLGAKDLVARVLQHEIDHLNGKLFIDYLSDAKRMALLKGYERKRKEKSKARAGVAL